MVHESFRWVPPSGHYARYSPLYRGSPQYQGVGLDALTTYSEGWSRLTFLDNVQHYVLVTPFTNTLLVVSISTLSFLSFFILIVLLMVLLVMLALES
jgi:hypothetical protein